MATDFQRQRAAETALANFAKHQRWTDAEGISRPLSAHRDYDICRRLSDRSQREASEQPDPALRIYPAICEAWRLDLRTFVLELGVTAGVRPKRYYRLRAPFPDEPLGPGNAEWYEPPLSRRQYYFVKRGGHLA